MFIELNPNVPEYPIFTEQARLAIKTPIDRDMYIVIEKREFKTEKEAVEYCRQRALVPSWTKRI